MYLLLEGKIMKKFMICVLFTFICVNNIFSRNYVKNDIDFTDYWYNISSSILSDESIEEKFYRDRIPEIYADAFLYYTSDKKEIRLNFYSIMVHESANFTAFVNKNANGSVDYGPSQLNSKNIEDAWFMEKFAPVDTSYITTLYCKYMVITINFYYDLYKTWGDYAFYAYNGGPRAARLMKQKITSPQFESLLNNVKYYNKSVRKNVVKYTIEYNDFMYNTRKDHIAKIKNEYDNMSFIIDSSSCFDELIIVNNINKFVGNRVFYYIKREDFSELKNEEIVIKIDSIIGKFKIEC